MASGIFGQGGGFGSNTINGFAGAVSDIFGGKAIRAADDLKAQGDLVEAGNYDLAAGYAGENAQYAEISGAVKTAQSERNVLLGTGQERSEIAGAGLKVGSGTSLDLLRSSVQQGALQTQMVQAQGQITTAGYKEEQASYENLASYARVSAQAEMDAGNQAEKNGWITGGIKALSGLASLF